MSPAEFIERWSKSGGAEIANSQSFLIQLCQLLGVPQPEPTRPEEEQNTYVFEKAVKLNNGDGTQSDGRIDLYRQGSFVLESKQGTERREAEHEALLAEKSKNKKLRKGHAERGSSHWVLVMNRARKQAERYAQAIPGEWPPFLVIVDVGHCIQLYADFSLSGKSYVPFPDPLSYQIWLKDLEPSIHFLRRPIACAPPDAQVTQRVSKNTESAASMSDMNCWQVSHRSTIIQSSTTFSRHEGDAGTRTPDPSHPSQSSSCIIVSIESRLFEPCM